MKILILSMSALFLMSITALADTPNNEAMKSAVCKLLQMQNQKSQSQRSVKDAAYQPGVDAYGNAVVVADIDNSQNKETIIIPIEIDMADKFDIPELGETKVSTAEIQPDGRVIFGENDVTDKIHDWCGTDVPEDIKKPVIDAPTVNEPETMPEKLPINQPEKVEVQPVEIKPAIAQPPLEIQDNKASNGTNVQKNIKETSDIITGTDYSE